MRDLSRRWKGVGLALAAAALACGEDGGSQPAPPAPAASPAPAAKPAPPPAEPTPSQPARAVPAAYAADAGRGAEHYATFCASCHGPRGCGEGPMAGALDPTPAKHCDGTYMNALSDAHLFEVIKEGGPAVGKSPLMAAWGGSLSDEQIHDVVAFVRSLADPPYEPDR